MTRAVVIGDALIDELRDDRGIREFVGGAGLNVAVGLARLGVPSTLIAMVGSDDDGDRIRAYLHDYGVALHATPGPFGSARAVSTRQGVEPAYEFNGAARARRVHFGPAETDALAHAEVVVVSSYPFDDGAQTLELSDALADSPARFVLDPNPREGLLRERAQFVRGFEGLLGRATLVKISDEDASLLYAQPVDAVRARLVDRGAAAVFATEGAGGASIEAGGDVVTDGISDLPGRIVDTMGAGDAAVAAVAAVLADGVPADADAWAAVLSRAMDVAAATCRQAGALLRTPESLARKDLDLLGT